MMAIAYERAGKDTVTQIRDAPHLSSNDNLCKYEFNNCIASLNGTTHGAFDYEFCKYGHFNASLYAYESGYYSMANYSDRIKYISFECKFMATTESIAVWIPLIVGLTPGLVYWLAITAIKKR